MRVSGAWQLSLRQKRPPAAAAESGLRRDAARANVVLAFEPDVSHHLRAAIPSEGGFLWTLGWMATTGLEFRLRNGLDYGQLMAHEHVNDAREIEMLVRALFEEVEVRSFGIGRQLSLYRFLSARRPRLDVADAWEARFA